MNTALLTELFGGAGRYKALRCLFEFADRPFATRELAVAAGIDPGNASRWLRRWADIGLLERHTERGQTLFQASSDPALMPLKLLVQQDSEMAQLLRARLESLEEAVDAAAIFGSAARGETNAGSDIDLLLIGPKLSRLSAQAHFKPAGRKLGRPVNVQVFTPQAWQAALESGDPFVHDIIAKPMVTLKGPSMLRKPEDFYKEGSKVFRKAPVNGESIQGWVKIAGGKVADANRKENSPTTRLGKPRSLSASRRAVPSGRR